MGTGVNVQRRLKALHHLDVPWLPSQIEQREGRIARQGNQNDAIDIYAYATLGSVDATSWQLLERKARFIAAALAGDRSIRRLEDLGSQANQFALAKALASGDPRLMQKAGLEADIARLNRLRGAHSDDQLAIRRQILSAKATIADSKTRIGQIEQDLALRTPTRGEAFAMEIGDRRLTDRKSAGGSLLSRIRIMERQRQQGTCPLASIGGFTLMASSRRGGSHLDVWLARTAYEQAIEIPEDMTPLGLIARLEHQLERFEAELAEHHRRIAGAEARLPGYEQRLGEAFPFREELEAKEAELAAIEHDLAGDTANDAAVL